MTLQKNVGRLPATISSAFFLPGRRVDRLLWAGLVLVFLAYRLPGLTRLPVFDDEADNLNAAAALFHGGLHRSCHQGKLLHVLLLAVTTPWASDPLWAGRFTSVLVGLLGMLACARLVEKLGESGSGAGEAQGPDGSSAAQGALLAMAFVCVTPMLIFLNRMALPDGLLTTTTALALMAGWDMGIESSGRHALRFGVTLALAVLSKPPGLIVSVAPLAAHWLTRHPDDRAESEPGIMRAWARAIGVAALICALPLAIFFRRNEEFSKSLLAEHLIPLRTLWLGNSRQAAEWLWFYWGPVVLPVGLIALLWSVWLYRRVRRTHRAWEIRRDAAPLYLAGFATIPIVTFTLTARVWYSRYFGFATLPLLALLAIAIQRLRWGSRLRIACGAAIAVLALAASLPLCRALWSEPSSAGLPISDAKQYITSWPSGYGTTEAVEWLKQAARNEPNGIDLVRHANDDQANKHLLRYLLRREPGIHIQSVDLTLPDVQATLRSASRPVYLFALRPSFSPADAALPARLLPELGTRVGEFPKPGGEVVVELYRLRKLNHRVP